jgi:hypothetical protein
MDYVANRKFVNGYLNLFVKAPFSDVVDYSFELAKRVDLVKEKSLKGSPSQRLADLVNEISRGFRKENRCLSEEESVGFVDGVCSLFLSEMDGRDVLQFSFVDSVDQVVKIFVNGVLVSVDVIGEKSMGSAAVVELSSLSPMSSDSRVRICGERFVFGFSRSEDTKTGGLVVLASLWDKEEKLYGSVLKNSILFQGLTELNVF